MKYNVLLIEDSPEIFTLVKQSLSSIANIMWADNLKKAEAILKESKVDLILLDVELPDGNGISFRKIMRSRIKDFTGIIVFTDTF